MMPNPVLGRARRYALLATIAALPVVFTDLEAYGGPVDDTQAGTVLVAGDPPLTRRMVEEMRRFLEWTLDSAMTETQARELQETLASTWRADEKGAIQQAQELLGLHERVRALPEAQRAFLREQMLPKLLTEWRSQPDDESSRWMLSIYEAAHEPIAAGDPPLTRQMSDAYAEALVFAARQATGRPFQADAAFKNLVAARLAERYAALALEAKQLLAACPLAWAAMRLAWPEVSAPEREDLKERWIAAFGNIAEPDTVTQAAERALTELEDLQHRDPSTALTPLEMRQAANRMEIVAEHLRHLGGAANARGADDLERTARAWRAAAAGAEAQPQAAGGSSAYEEAMELQRRQHNLYVALSNAALTSHVGTMNMISIMSGGPYRYTVR